MTDKKMSSSTTASVKDQLLAKLLNDETLHDVTLQGSDGVPVSACRKVLAAGSDFFRTLFCGPFEESSTQTVEISKYKGQELKEILQYLHLETMPILEQNMSEFAAFGTTNDNDDDNNADNHCPNNAFQTFFQHWLRMYGAAAYFELPTLRQRLDQTMAHLIQINRTAALWLLPHEEGLSEATMTLAWNEVRSRRNVIVTDPAVRWLPKAVIEAVLQDERLAIEEYDLFRMLQIWAKNAPNNAERQDQAKEMAQKYLRLELMDPQKLATEVTASGWVSAEALAQAYKSIALAATPAQRDAILPPVKRQRFEWDPHLTPKQMTTKRRTHVVPEIRAWDDRLSRSSPEISAWGARLSRSEVPQWRRRRVQRVFQGASLNRLNASSD